jgi:predicted O-methyltransferase YrrM
LPGSLTAASGRKLVAKSLAALRRGGLSLVAAKIGNYAREWYQFHRAARVMRQAGGGRGGIDEALRFAYTFDCDGVRISPTQLVSEIKAFSELVDEASPQRVVEIGTGLGGTLFLLARMSSRTATIVSVDIDYPFFRTELYKAFSTDRQQIHLVIADSHEEATVTKVRKLLKKQPIDLLFIDGDHGYESVREDFDKYGNLVTEGGLIALHDIVPGESSGGVPRFWQEIRGLYSTAEFVESWDQGGFGIGLIRKRNAGKE